MILSKKIINLRKKLQTAGDNIEVAEIASNASGKRVTPQSVYNTVDRGRGNKFIVSALEEYYLNKKERLSAMTQRVSMKHKGIRSLSNVEMSQ